ncbi:hypothetical protein [Mangrovibacter phragmitis]|uniref:hypothetical protein n=1 Tax=Mangrovibacter phragmitis TaxID=1691903 RepID=UPI00351623BB
MIDFNIDISSGELFFNGERLEAKDHSGWVASPIYDKFKNVNEADQIIPYHYLVNNVLWMGRVFELTIRPACFENTPFMLYFVNKGGGYYRSLSNWEKRSDINMLECEVGELFNWLLNELRLSDDYVKIGHGYRWEFSWGRISASFETKSFNCGIYISYY